MAYQWQWSVFLQEPNAGQSYLDWLLSGLGVTVALGLSAWVLALALGTLLGIMRTLPNRLLSGLAACYVELFRNVPLLVQIFIWYFAMPELLPFGDAVKSMPPMEQQFTMAMLCLGMFTAARVCEQVRSGIESLPRGQKGAGLALGLTLGQDLPLRTVADVVSHRAAAVDVGVPQYLQELGGGVHHRLAGAGRTRTPAGRLHRPAI